MSAAFFLSIFTISHHHGTHDCSFCHTSIDKFLVQAGNAAQFDGNASVEQGLEKLGLPSIATPLPHMEIPLMPHQVIGVAWMMEKEASPNKGGCLGDDMGLGKVSIRFAS